MGQTQSEDLFAPVRDLAEGDALEDWRWLVGKNCHALLLTAMGDVFLRRPPRLLRREAIFFLDTMSGQLERVAKSYEELRGLFGSEGAERWLLPELVSSLRERGIVLSPGQCYSLKHPPALGGSIEAENFEASDWRVHLSLAGQIHEQLKGVPDGAKIKLEVVP